MTSFTRFFKRAAVVLAGTALAASTATVSANAADGVPSIGYGHSLNGNAVWCVQHQYNYYVGTHSFVVALSDLPASVAEDSQWGPETQNMVIKWQTFWGLQPDGIVGPQTGHQFLWVGDPYYTGKGSSNPSNAYCYGLIPGTL
ncbi:peptidoglycan-binding protein [Kitasatospora sp. NPDC053057]|uniref:peptidoglycan-binding protein n=1 Tax=Kitasatospora sp. NPDC053057 TaxID=3364062 RepID=UPI0037C65F1C